MAAIINKRVPRDLPTGQISMSQVNEELGHAPNAPISLGQADVRDLAEVPTGQISMSDLQGKQSGAGPITSVTHNTIQGSDQLGKNVAFSNGVYLHTNWVFAGEAQAFTSADGLAWTQVAPVGLEPLADLGISVDPFTGEFVRSWEDESLLTEQRSLDGVNWGAVVSIAGTDMPSGYTPQVHRQRWGATAGDRVVIRDVYNLDANIPFTCQKAGVWHQLLLSANLFNNISDAWWDGTGWWLVGNNSNSGFDGTRAQVAYAVDIADPDSWVLYTSPIIGPSGTDYQSLCYGISTRGLAVFVGGSNHSTTGNYQCWTFDVRNIAAGWAQTGGFTLPYLPNFAILSPAMNLSVSPDGTIMGIVGTGNFGGNPQVYGFFSNDLMATHTSFSTISAITGYGQMMTYVEDRHWTSQFSNSGAVQLARSEHI